MADLGPRSTGDAGSATCSRKSRSRRSPNSAARRWSMAFKMLVMIYLFLVLFLGMGWLKKAGDKSTGKHTAMVELRGVIASEGRRAPT